MRMTDLRSDHHLSGKAAFTRAVQRTLSRTKAKVLQRVGKVEKTTDETFDENVANFQKQQSAATRIQKEIQNYITCVRAMTQATHSLHTAIQTTYEMEWLDYNSIDAALKDLNLAAISYETELTQKVYADLSSYIDEFPAYKMKIQKRRRKMLDYDNAKHDFDSMSSSKKPDHAKICKSQEAMLEAQRLFDEINQEMHHELPAFYEYRVPFLANNLNDLYSSANTYHAQSVRATETLTDMLQTLVTNHNEEMVRLQRSANHGGAPEGYNSEPGSPVLHHNIRTSPLRSPSTRLAESTPKTKVIVHQTASHAQHPASHNNESEDIYAIPQRMPSRADPLVDGIYARIDSPPPRPAVRPSRRPSLANSPNNGRSLPKRPSVGPGESPSIAEESPLKPSRKLIESGDHESLTDMNPNKEHDDPSRLEEAASSLTAEARLDIETALNLADSPDSSTDIPSENIDRDVVIDKSPDIPVAIVSPLPDVPELYACSGSLALGCDSPSRDDNEDNNSPVADVLIESAHPDAFSEGDSLTPVEVRLPDCTTTTIPPVRPKRIHRPHDGSLMNLATFLESCSVECRWTAGDDMGFVVGSESSKLTDLTGLKVRKIKGGTRISSGNSKQANISSNGGTGSLNYDKGDLPSTSQSSETNRRVLYQVYSTHPYVAEDEDELAFDSGELINVVEFSDSDDQDEGWLMGIGVTSGRKGVFPANFTQRLQRK